MRLNASYCIWRIYYYIIRVGGLQESSRSFDELLAATVQYLSYIHLGSSVCHPVILSSCHSCGTLSYSLCLSNQTDQGDEREGFEREGLEVEGGKGQIAEGGCEKTFLGLSITE